MKNKNLNKKVAVILCIVTLFVLSAFTFYFGYQLNDSDFTVIYDKAGMDGTRIYRFVDEEADAVCWVYSSFQQGGISCLPTDETSIR